MIDKSFEWDDAKAAQNLSKHGVSFEEAKAVFRDPFAIELLDDRHDYGEERHILIGMSASNVLVVVHTDRNDKHRIISARKAEPNERKFYHDENR
ncbi:MAG: BrnT family toxin [Pseudomonadota bacterium]